MDMVYWSIIPNHPEDGIPPKQYIFRRLMAEISEARNPENEVKLALAPTISSADNPTFLSCPAVSGMMKNTFVVHSAGDTGVFLEESESGWDGKSYGSNKWIMPRPPGIKDSANVWMADESIIFFSEKSMTLQFCAPFFSQTRHMQWGVVTPGQMDISGWFRPLQFEFTLWPGVREMHLQTNEPMAYVQFFTDEKVGLQHFNGSDEIYGLIDELLHATYVDRKKPLADRYAFFKENGYKDRVLEAIKTSM